MTDILGLVRWVMKGKSGVAATLQTLLFQVLIQSINILTGMITARTLAPSGRGELASILLWPNLLGSMFALGLGPALLYNLKKAKKYEGNDPRFPSLNPSFGILLRSHLPINLQLKWVQSYLLSRHENLAKYNSEVYSAALLMGTVFGAVAAALGFCLMPVFLKNYPDDTVLIARFFVLTAPVNLLTLLVLNAYRARNKFNVVNQTNSLTPVFALSLLGGLAFFQKLIPLSAAIARRGPVIVIFCWKFIDQWRYFRPNFRNLQSRCLQLLSYSWRSAPINILSQFADKIDQVLVVGYLTSEQMGYYIVALSLSRLLNIIYSSILSVLFPKAAGRGQQEVVDLAGRAARIGMVCSLAAALSLIVFGAPIMGIYGGEKFLLAVPIFQLLSLEVVIKGVTLVLAQSFMALGRPGVVSVLQGVGLGLSFPLMSFLIPRYGLMGTGWALLCSTSVRLVFILFCYPIVLKTRPPSLLPSPQDFIYLKNVILNRRAKT